MMRRRRIAQHVALGLVEPFQCLVADRLGDLPDLGDDRREVSVRRITLARRSVGSGQRTTSPSPSSRSRKATRVIDRRPSPRRSGSGGRLHVSRRSRGRAPPPVRAEDPLGGGGIESLAKETIGIPEEKSDRGGGIALFGHKARSPCRCAKARVSEPCTIRAAKCNHGDGRAPSEPRAASLRHAFCRNGTDIHCSS